ncbi:MAG: 50S ribosomal protein L25 [Kiritimatiellae bacterium]|nr:50S ribosomal protein L25 [Kiritimatiellia bacterium]
MAKEMIILKAEERTEQGSAASRRLRRAGYIPGAVTRIEGGASLLLKINAREFGALLRKHGEQQQLLKLDISGKETAAMLREIQYHPVTGLPTNADFGEIDLSQKVRISIPLEVVGEPAGVRLEGGILQQMLHEVEVECLPTDVVDKFEIDVSELKLDQSLFVKDLKLGDAYTIVTEKTDVVALVSAPEDETAAASAEGEAGKEEPEVITKGKKDEAGEGGDKAAAAKSAKK